VIYNEPATFPTSIINYREWSWALVAVIIRGSVLVYNLPYLEVHLKRKGSFIIGISLSQGTLDITN